MMTIIAKQLMPTVHTGTLPHNHRLEMLFFCFTAIDVDRSLARKCLYIALIRKFISDCEVPSAVWFLLVDFG